MNPINNDHQCFQYAATVGLNHEEIGKNSQRISNIKPVVNKYNWKIVHHLSGKNDWKKFG